MNYTVNRYRQCEAKVTYASRKAGLNFLRDAKNRGVILTPTLNVYKCPWCSKWHVGHSNR